METSEGLTFVLCHSAGGLPVVCSIQFNLSIMWFSIGNVMVTKLIFCYISIVTGFLSNFKIQWVL